MSALRTLCVVLHDVAAPTWPACRAVLAPLDALNVPVTLLAVPRYHGAPSTPEFEAWLRQRVQRGDEVALHGFVHRDDAPARHWVDRIKRRIYTRSEGELCGLNARETHARLHAGLEWLAHVGVTPAGYVAPAWLMNDAAWQIVPALGFRYTCTLRHIDVFEPRVRLTSQSVVYSTSTAWRRAASTRWNAAVARWEAGNSLLRVELHPADGAFADITASWQRILTLALQTRAARTLSDMLDHHVTPHNDPAHAAATMHVRSR